MLTDLKLGSYDLLGILLKKKIVLGILSLLRYVIKFQEKRHANQG